ncbi:hypothetical protein Tsubulata_028449 [Turnera subulata]|uniref:Glycosyltransferase family 28 N-terminal domain-containing protein n=1 Tax=Turnera subulata TaxID=218843 RepID=A0A9Q0IZW4_9ROSI|nr:hypothetical protein Tsubulata_028449 [Turnera subulata]
MEETESRKAIAAFMAFGTKGDVYPIAAIAAAFAVDQKRHRVVLVTHSAHESLAPHLEERHVGFVAIESPPVLSVPENHDSAEEIDFSLQKKAITREHRQQCYSAVEQIFGPGPSMESDFILINFFALEGWSLAELFRVRCIIAAPYVVPYSAPSAFENHFRMELPLLYKCLQAAPSGKVCWKDVTHWMWPLFTNNWGSWRSDDLNLSSCPFTHIDRLLAIKCSCLWVLVSPHGMAIFVSSQVTSFFEISSFSASHFHRTNMGFLRNPRAFLQVLQTVLGITNYRFILFTAGYEPLDEAVKVIGAETSSQSEREYNEEGVCLFDGRLFCFPGSHSSWGQILCPFMLDQFYWAEKMHWIGVAPEPLNRNHFIPDKLDDSSIRIAANVLLRALKDALSPEVKERALEIAERISREETESRKAIAAFMAFGTKGDVYPIAAIAAAFAVDNQKRHRVVLITLSAHEIFPCGRRLSLENTDNNDILRLNRFSGRARAWREGWSLAELFRVCWKDVTHWMWLLFTDNWGSWRSDDLNLSSCPFTTIGHQMFVFVGFGFSPWNGNFCVRSVEKFQHLVLCRMREQKTKYVHMGFLRNPRAFLRVLQTVLGITNYRFILFTAGYEPLDEAVKVIGAETSSQSEREYNEEGVCLFDGRLFCFPGSHSSWGQILCPFMLDQFYWAEKMHWIGVAPEPLNRNHFIPDKLDDSSIRIAANVLLRALKDALSPEVKERALEIAERISREDGVSEAVKIIKREMNCSK